MITLSSIFRDAAGHVGRYFAQVAALREKVDVRLVLGEGDSTDDTYELLHDNLEPGDVVVKVDHGGPVFGSIDHPQRWEQISQVVRGVVAEVDPHIKSYIWVEGDLIWDVDTMLALLDARRPVAPMVFCDTNRERLYDTWGARQNGRMLFSHPPYFPRMHFTPGDWPPKERYEPIDSCGSCFVTPDFKPVRKWDGMWPFAVDNLVMDTRLKVWHP